MYIVADKLLIGNLKLNLENEYLYNLYGMLKKY
jgi:hypothetical protein